MWQKVRTASPRMNQSSQVERYDSLHRITSQVAPHRCSFPSLSLSLPLSHAHNTFKGRTSSVCFVCLSDAWVVRGWKPSVLLHAALSQTHACLIYLEPQHPSLLLVLRLIFAVCSLRVPFVGRPNGKNAPSCAGTPTTLCRTSLPRRSAQCVMSASTSPTSSFACSREKRQPLSAGYRRKKPIRSRA